MKQPTLLEVQPVKPKLKVRVPCRVPVWFKPVLDDEGNVASVIDMIKSDMAIRKAGTGSEARFWFLGWCVDATLSAQTVKAILDGKKPISRRTAEVLEIMHCVHGYETWTAEQFLAQQQAWDEEQIRKSQS